jgi:hypothetical protein
LDELILERAIVHVLRCPLSICRATGKEVKRLVLGDPAGPGEEPGAWLELVDFVSERDRDLLKEVFSIVHGVDNAVDKPKELPAVSAQQLGELFFAGLRRPAKRWDGYI